MNNKNQHIPAGYKPSPLGIIPEDWEVRKLGEVCAFLRTNTLSRNQLNDTDGEVRNIHYGDVLVKYPSIIDARKQSIPFVNQEDYKESMNDFIEDGDIVLADTAEDETVGKACEIANIGSEKILSGLHTMLIRPQKGLFFPCFLGYQVNSVSYRKQLNALIQGIKVCSLGKQAIANTYFAVPPLPKQQRIVSVLSLWDTAIAKQTALIEKLTLRKRGLMQQLLTGKKRLKGFSGEWKTIELGDALSYIQPTKYLVVSENYNNTYNTPVLTAGKTFILGYTDETTGVFNDLPAIIFDDFTTESKYVTFPFKAKSSAMKILKAHNSNLYFMFCAMQMIKYSIGGHERHWISKFSHLTLKVPSLDEQNAIATVLVQSDKEIETQKQKLAAMQEQKKGLMQVLLTGRKRVRADRRVCP